MVSYLYSFFLNYTNIWDQKVQNSVFYEAFLPITWIKPSAGVTRSLEQFGWFPCARSHSFLFSYQTETYARHHGARKTMLVANDLLPAGSTQYWTHVCVCVRVPWSYKFWFWTKFLINWAVVSSNDFKRTTMSLDVYFISFFLFCHQTGQWIAQITERTRYCQPRF